MTPYYPTIDEDLKRADEILEKGRGNGEGATIYGVDITAAYQLLRSFVQHIRYQHGQMDASHKMIEALERSKQLMTKLNRTAQEQITEATAARDEYAARAAAAPPAPTRQGPLAIDHPLVNQLCPACLKLIRAGAFVALVTIGPGEDTEERARAVAGRPYNAVAVAAHWACVTGQDGES